MNKVHYRNIRLLVNAGMDFPECKAYEDLLDLDAGRWKTTSRTGRVTCKKCIEKIKG